MMISHDPAPFMSWSSCHHYAAYSDELSHQSLAPYQVIGGNACLFRLCDYTSADTMNARTIEYEIWKGLRTRVQLSPWPTVRSFQISAGQVVQQEIMSQNS